MAKQIYTILIAAACLCCYGSGCSAGNAAPTAEANTMATYEDSPFGFHDLQSYEPEIANVGGRWVRLSGQTGLVWDADEPQQGVYNWDRMDRLIKSFADHNINLLVTITTFSKWDRSLTTVPAGPKIGKLPVHIDAYKNYLRAAVARYPRVRYYQIENEPTNTWEDTTDNFATLVKVTYETIKAAKPDANVIIAGAATPHDLTLFFVPVIQRLATLRVNSTDRFFDGLDLHWSGQFQNSPDQSADYRQITIGGSSTTLNDTVAVMKNAVTSNGFTEVPIWITEMSDYSDQPPGYSFRSESQHASGLVKRYVYPLSLGVKRILWVSLTEFNGWMGAINNYWDNVGIINNALNGDNRSHRKLAWYSYKLMTEKLEGCDWNNTQVIQNTSDLHVIRFIRNGKPIWVAWNDSGAVNATITGVTSARVRITPAVPAATSGASIADYKAAFTSTIQNVPSQQVTVILNAVPVYIEPQ